MLHLLDTDHVSFLEGAGAEGQAIRARLRLIAPDDYGITVISYVEQIKGWLAEVARAWTPQEEVISFARLLQGYRYCSGFAIWEYTAEAAEQGAALRCAKIRMSTQDIRIASIALVNNATLLTRNTSDFERVSGLLIEDWSK